MKEIWKKVVNKNGYEVSNLGRVRSVNRIVLVKRKNKNVSIKYPGKILKQKKPSNKCRYYMVNLGYDRVFVHRIVAMSFVNNEHNKPQVNHINANILDNRACNLEWVTPKENMDHARKLGGLKDFHGSRIHCSLITEDTAREIKQLMVSRPELTNRNIQRLTGVPDYIIFKIRYGMSWGRVYVKGWIPKERPGKGGGRFVSKRHALPSAPP